MGVADETDPAGRVDHDIKTGQFLTESSRHAQARSDCNSVRVNVTEFGKRYHGLEDGQELSVMVFDEGIWITTTSDDGR
jgi:hypothetical protein